jgi:hypothetical protein
MGEDGRGELAGGVAELRRRGRGAKGASRACRVSTSGNGGGITTKIVWPLFAGAEPSASMAAARCSGSMVRFENRRRCDMAGRVGSRGKAASIALESSVRHLQYDIDRGRMHSLNHFGSGFNIDLCDVGIGCRFKLAIF